MCDVLQEAAMAKLAASEAATFCSHQVRKLRRTDDTDKNALFFTDSLLSFTPGDSGPGWDGVRVGHARRKALPRRSHHRDLRGHQ